MRQLNEQIQSTEKQLKDLQKQINDLQKHGKKKLNEENEDLKIISKINKEDINNYKNQIKDLESKTKTNEEAISKLKSENEQLKRGINNQAQSQNNQINNSINNIRDLSQSLGINLMEISNDDEIGNNNNERNEQNRENIRANALEEIQIKKLNYEMKFLELKEKCNKFYKDMNGLKTIIDNYKTFLNETNQKMNDFNERLNISLIDVNNGVNSEGNRKLEEIYLQIDNISIPLVELDEILFNIKKIFGDNIENLLKEIRENLMIIDQKNYNDENHLNNINKKISHNIEEVQNVIFIFEENKKNFDDKNKIIEKKVDDLKKNLELIDRRRRENRSHINNPNEDNNNNNRIENNRGFDTAQSFLFKEKDLSEMYDSRYVFSEREEDMIENYIDEPKLIRKNWHEICYIYDDYDIHDIYYDIKAVGLSRNSFFPLCSHGFNYEKDIEIDSLTLNGEPARYSQNGHSITFKINLHNSQIAKVHIIYKEYMNDNILSNQEREHRQIYRNEYYGIHKSLQGQMAKFSLILKGNFDIVNFKNYFLTRNKKNLNEKEYFWAGVVPYEGKMTLITLSKNKAVWTFSVTLTIRSNYNLNRTAIAVPIEFIGGNNEIINIKYSSPQTRDILLDQENRQYVIKYRNVHNNIGEFTIEGQLENKSIRK